MYFDGETLISLSAECLVRASLGIGCYYQSGTQRSLNVFLKLAALLRRSAVFPNQREADTDSVCVLNVSDQKPDLRGRFHLKL